jgi:hypothetical protein
MKLFSLNKEQQTKNDAKAFVNNENAIQSLFQSNKSKTVENQTKQFCLACYAKISRMEKNIFFKFNQLFIFF